MPFYRCSYFNSDVVATPDAKDCKCIDCALAKTYSCLVCNHRPMTNSDKAKVCNACLLATIAFNLRKPEH